MLSEHEKKERRRESDRLYRENNKEKEKERARLYYQNNKEKQKERNRLYYQNNKEKENERHRAYSKAYYQTEQGKKRYRIGKWKAYGVICENFDNLYDYFINCKDCEHCGIELTVDKRSTATTRCLDHCHKTGEFRNVLCHSCNTKRK